MFIQNIISNKFDLKLVNNVFLYYYQIPYLPANKLGKGKGLIVHIQKSLLQRYRLIFRSLYYLLK